MSFSLPPDLQRSSPSSAIGTLERPIAARRRAAGRPGRRSRIPVEPWLTATVLAAIVGIVGVRGADYPAQLFRAAHWVQSGPAVWNFDWYGGHATPTYSILTPPAAAVLGVFVLTAASTVVATFCFSQLSIALGPSAVAGHLFALGASVNVVVGRTAFAFGTALALGALLAWYRRHFVAAVVAALLTPLASPVAAAFLAVIALAVIVHVSACSTGGGGRSFDPLTRPVAILAATTVPVGVTMLLFHEPTRFPYEVGGLVVSIAVLGTLVALAPRPVVRIAAGLAVVVALVTFVVPNPLGGNFSRLTQLVGVPVAACALAARDERAAGDGRGARLPRRWSAVTGAGVGAVGCGLAMWTVAPAVAAIADWYGDPSVDQAYHASLIEEVRARNRDGQPIGRLEVPFTENHWESLYVGAQVPYARGWERQVDLARNPILYDPDLTDVGYRSWLLANGVRWVAVPDVALDEGGRPEASVVALQETGQPGASLREVWSDDHWSLYEVAGYRPIVDPPARLVAQAGDRIVIATTRSADVTIRYRYSPHLSIAPSGSLRADDEGWIRAHLPHPGTFELRADLAVSTGGSA